MKSILIVLFVILSSWISINILSSVDNRELPSKPIQMDPYWHQGKAEVSKYNLKQNRYNDEHDGYAVLIQVAEDFLTDKQVKNDAYTSESSIPVMKTNLTERFTTGIYDYSLMTSSFTSTSEKPKTYKVSFSGQDWCGQSYAQINRRKNQYTQSLFSYFESEGDKSHSEKLVMLEDEIFSLIRINPSNIPTGKVDIIPSQKILRLLHLPFKSTKATISNGFAPSGSDGGMPSGLQQLTITFPELNRKLQIQYDLQPPHTIQGWTDSYPSMFDRQMRTTKAELTHQILTDYWKHNTKEDLIRRNELGLPLKLTR